MPGAYPTRRWRWNMFANSAGRIEVAARYHPPGVPIIPPAQTRGFVWATVIGVGLQWAISLPIVLSGQTLPALPEASRFGAWWVSYGLGALWWPGFLVSVMIVAAWVRQTWPAASADWKPRAIDQNQINRLLFLFGLAGALCGVALWVGIAWSVTTFDNPFTRALAFDADFLATRAPVLLVFWAGGIALLVVLIIEGRWRDLTRRIDLGLRIIACALMAWFILGGRIFLADPADQTAKGAMALIVLLMLGQFAFDAWRLAGGIRPPQAGRS